MMTTFLAISAEGEILVCTAGMSSQTIWLPARVDDVAPTFVNGVRVRFCSIELNRDSVDRSPSTAVFSGDGWYADGRQLPSAPP